MKLSKKVCAKKDDNIIGMSQILLFLQYKLRYNGDK